MNDITPKEAIEILSHYTDLGYGIVIEGEDTSKIKQALSLACKTLAHITEGDLIMFRTLMTEIANKGLPFEEVLLLIDNAKTPTEGDCISREALKEKLKERYYNDGLNIVTAIELIDNAPPVDMSTELSVAYLKGRRQGQLEERPKGEWKTVEGYDNDEYYECSNCGEPWVLMAGTPKDNNMNFCPNCGVDMKGGAE